jgi:hypothetical protein
MCHFEFEVGELHMFCDRVNIVEWVEWAMLEVVRTALKTAINIQKRENGESIGRGNG